MPAMTTIPPAMTVPVMIRGAAVPTAVTATAMPATTTTAMPTIAAATASVPAATTTIVPAIAAATTSVPAAITALAMPILGEGRGGCETQHGGKRHCAEQRFKRHGRKTLQFDWFRHGPCLRRDQDGSLTKTWQAEVYIKFIKIRQLHKKPVAKRSALGQQSAACNFLSRSRAYRATSS